MFSFKPIGSKSLSVLVAETLLWVYRGRVSSKGLTLHCITCQVLWLRSTVSWSGFGYCLMCVILGGVLFTERCTGTPLVSSMMMMSQWTSLVRLISAIHHCTLAPSDSHRHVNSSSPPLSIVCHSVCSALEAKHIDIYTGEHRHSASYSRQSDD